MTTGDVLYIARGAATRDEIVASLRALLPMRERGPEPRRWTCYDTFDGRVTRSGARLEVAIEDGRQRVRWTNGEASHAHELVLEAAVGFAWDLPDGPLRRELEPVIEMRRLLPLVEVDGDGTWLDVVDERDKAVARVRLDSGRARSPGPDGGWHPLPATLRVVPVRGYDRDYARLCAIVESRPGVEKSSLDPQGVVLQAAGVAPPRDVSEWRARLEPSVTAADGLRQIHGALLRVALANEAGVRADVDSEFLHDFRVAIRRTRACLTQFKHVYPPAAITRFKPELSWLGQITGPTRDLDVFLLDIREAHIELPPGDLSVLRAHLEGEQRRAHRQMVEQLDSRRYRELIASWGSFLGSSDAVDPVPSNAERPLVDVASELSWKLYRRMVKRGEAVHGETPPEVMHELRLDSKKLRYVIDCTRSLFRGKHVVRLVAALKKLQDVLGNYNDAEVQQGRLRDYAQSLAKEGHAEASTLFNLGKLAEQNRERAGRERLRFSQRFEEFAGSETRGIFHALFKSRAKPGSES